MTLLTEPLAEEEGIVAPVNIPGQNTNPIPVEEEDNCAPPRPNITGSYWYLIQPDIWLEVEDAGQDKIRLLIHQPPSLKELPPGEDRPPNEPNEVYVTRQEWNDGFAKWVIRSGSGDIGVQA